MSSDRKPVIEKRYAIPTKESMRAVAESVGYELDDDSVSLLCEDLSYRVRQIVQSGSKYMRHAKRRKLTVTDVNNALRTADIQPVYGQSTPEPSSFHYIRDAGLYVNDDPDVNLINVAFNDEPNWNPGETSVKAYWLAVEGVQRTATQKPVEKKVSDDLLVYYDQMAKALLGSDMELVRTALSDLRTNPKILPVVPYFVNFVSTGVTKLSHDVGQLMRLLETVQALMSNGCLYVEPRPYLSTVIQAVMYCLVEPLAASINPFNDHWRLRDYAARLLAQIAHKWSSAVNQLMFKTTQALKEVLLGQDRRPCSQYGAVAGLMALGPSTLEKILVPHLTNYLSKRQGQVSGGPALLDSMKVDGAILNACVALMTQKSEDASFHSKMAKLYKDLYSYYGEALSCRFPEVHPGMFAVARKTEAEVRLYEPLRSGEEMLAEFMEMVKSDHRPGLEDAKSEQTDRSENNEDMDSPASYKSDRSDRSDYDESSGVHLAVKSTVNDPNLGIKLTITKRHAKDDARRKIKKRRIKYKVQDVFESENFQRYHPFVFNVPRLVKWNSKATSKDFTLDFVASKESMEFRRLFLTHPPYWNAKKRIRKKKAYLLVNSCSVLCTL